MARLGYWQNTEHQQAKFNDYEALRPFASRAAQNALRIATVLTFFDKRQQVDAEMMQAAYLIAEHSLQEWKRYADAVVIDPATQLAQTALDWLLKEVAKGKWLEFDGLEWNKSGCNTNQLRKVANRNKAFSILIASNHLLQGINKEYRLNPLLLNAPEIVAIPAIVAISEESQALNSAIELRSVAILETKPKPVAIESQAIAKESQAVTPIKPRESQQSQESQPLANEYEKQPVAAPEQQQQSLWTGVI